MKTSYNRRKFLKAAALSIGSVSITSIPFIAKAEQKMITKTPISSSLSLKRKAAEAFYKKEYDIAQNLYETLIKENPSDISCYDGLSKVFNHKSDYLSAIRIFKQGLDLNETNPVFYDRLAKALSRLSLGSLKQEKIYNGGNLFEESAHLYLKAISIAPDKKYLRLGLLDTIQDLSVKNKQLISIGKTGIDISSDLLTEIENKTDAYKSFRLKKYTHKIISSLSVKQLENNITRLESKKRRKLYFDSEIQERYHSMQKTQKMFLSTLFYKAIEQNDITKTIDLFDKIKKCDARDTHIKGKTVKFLTKQERYSDIVNLYESQKIVSPWEIVGLSKAILLKSEKENNLSDIMQSIQLYQELQQLNINNLKLNFSIYNGLGECYLILKNYNKCRQTYLQGIEKTGYGHISESLCVKYAESYLSEGKVELAEILLISLKGTSVNEDKTSVINDNLIMDTIEKVKQEKKWVRDNGLSKNRKSKQHTTYRISDTTKVSELQNLNILYSLAKLYEKTGNTNALNQTLSEIQEQSSSNPFLKKRKVN